jgi:virulence factor
MRIAVIGLGSIARKAYLPVLTARADVDLVFCTRNRATLDALAHQYRVAECVSDVRELFTGQKKVDAAFVHTATESHVDVVSALLRNGVHTYVDKPLAYSYEESRKLVELSESAGRILMVGFNRRFAPMVSRLGDTANPQLILLQKNRLFEPGAVRRFVFDDFIHVVDTLRYLAPGEPSNVRVSSLQKDGLLHQILLQWDHDHGSVIGIMNRDSGITEETLEVMSPGNKWVVRNLSETMHYHKGEERHLGFNDWDSVLFRRGFEQIVDHFLACARDGTTPSVAAQDALQTHALCEQICEQVVAAVG